MKTCQFCGAVLESAQPPDEENPQAKLSFEEPGPGLPVQEVATAPPDEKTPPDQSALAFPPVDASAGDGNNLAPIGDSLPAQENDRLEIKPEKAKPKTSEPKNRASSCLLPALIGLVVIWLLLFFGYRLVSNFSGAGNSPAGTAARLSGSANSSGAAAAADLGVDVYPGARPISGADRRDSTDSTVVSQSFVSNDKMDLVINFYKARMVGQTSIYASGNGVVVSIAPSPQDSILVAIAPQPGGGTRIAITRTTAKSP